MDFRGCSQKNDQGKKATKLTWNKREEETLLSILEYVVAQGHRCDSGCFKTVITLLIKKTLNNLCPTSNLKANMYIE